MPAFPHHLCTILHAGSERPDPVVLRSEVERGLARQRRSAADARVQVSLQLGFETLAAADEFEAWFYGEALGGAAWFSFTHPRGDRVVTARVVGGSLGAITPLAEAYRVAERTVDIEYIRQGFQVLPPGLHPVSPSRVLATQRNSTATFVDAAGVLQMAAVNVPRFTYFSGKNIYSGARDIVVGPGFYGAAHAIKTAANNPANLRPGETLTVSAQVYQDAASLADGVGRVAQLFLWAQNAAGVWQVQSSVIGADIQPSGRLSASITLPALPSDMDSVTVGLYHIGGNGAWLGTVRADAVMVERGAVATAYEPGAKLLVEAEATNLMPQSDNISTWASNGATLSASPQPAPDGSNTAYAITSATGTMFSMSSPLVVGQDYTISQHVKPAPGQTALRLYADGPGLVVAVDWNLADNISVFIGPVTRRAIRALGNGWYRTELSFVAVNSGLNVHAHPGIGTVNQAFWRTQVEAGTVATSPIQTTTAPATRAADLIQVAA